MRADLSQEPTVHWQPLLAHEESAGTAATLRMSFRPQALEASAELAATHCERLPQVIVGPEAPAPSDSAGGYRIDDTLGAGGFGTVFRATQLSLGREVALKVLHGHVPPEQQGSFLAEARVTGALEHANVVPVHELGRGPDGAPLIAMKLVRGRSWSERLAEEPTPCASLREHLSILITVCHAVAYAHGQGVLHRDLKPDNVMLDGFGQVFVVDWGLAAGTDAERSRRLGIPPVADADGVAGTPACMAPEQANGVGAEQGVHTDVYLLGACLHRILVRGPRHRGKSVIAVLRSALESAPPEYPPEVPAELARIARRALAAEASARFPDVSSFREALEGYLEHEHAMRLGEEAQERAGALRAARSRWREAPAEERDPLLHEIERLAVESRFAAVQALRSWPEAEGARAALRDTARLQVAHGLDTDDLPLARRHLEEAEDPELVRRVEALRARLGAREDELRALRERARRLDWSAMTGPLGGAFALAGAVGCGGAFASAQVWRLPDADAYTAHLALMWAAVFCVCGGSALALIRAGRVPDSLLSTRMLGTWGGVAVACALNGVVVELNGIPRAIGVGFATIYLAIGFTAMAFQTRRWLLFPAAACYLGALAISLRPAWGVELFGLLWLSVLGGSGAALKLGATLDEREESPRGLVEAQGGVYGGGTCTTTPPVR